MSTRNCPFLAVCAAIAVAMIGVRPAAAEDVSLDVLLDLNNLTREQLNVLEEEIDKAEQRWLSLFVGKRTFPNREPRTADGIRSYFKSIRDEMAKIRGAVEKAPERWQRRPPDAKVIPLIYEQPRRALALVWEIHRAEAAQRVHSLAEDQKEAHAALYKERERLVEDLKRRFGVGSAEYRAGLARYDAILKRKRERERKEQMREAYAEATQRLLAGRRLLCGEAWRWMDIARRRGDLGEAQKFTVFAYRQFAYDRRPVEELEAILGKGNASGIWVLHTWLDLRRDRLDIRTFFLWEPQETLHMYRALADEPVERLRKFDDTPLPDILEKNFRIANREIDIGSAEAERLQRELREARERVRRTTEDFNRAEAEFENKRDQLAGIDQELVRLAAERDAALKKSRDLMELAETAQQRFFTDRIRANERRMGEIIQRLDALKAKGTLSRREIEERNKLLEEYDRIQKDQIDNQNKLAGLRTAPPDEAKRQEELAKKQGEDFWEAMRRRARADSEVSLASDRADKGRKELSAAEQQVVDLRDKQAQAGAPLEGKVREIWIRSADTKESYYREESYFSLDKRLAALDEKLKEAAARGRLLEQALEDRTKDYQKFTRERNLAGSDLEAAMKRSGWTQSAFQTAKAAINIFIPRAFGPFGSLGMALLEGILGSLDGGFTIEEVDFASAVNIDWNEAAMAGLPPGFVKAVKAREWSNAFQRELDQYLTNETSLEELGERLESLETVPRWLDGINAEIDPLFLAFMMNFGEKIDAFFRSEAVAKLAQAQVRASIATMLFQKTSQLAQEAFVDWRALRRAKDRILAGHEARTGLVTTEKKDFPRDVNLEIFIGHDDIERLNLEVELGGQKAEVRGDTLITREDRNQPTRWFRLSAQDVRKFKDDGKGGVELKIRAIP